MTTRRPLRIAALAAAVGLTLAACGGSDSADDTAAPPADTAAEAAPQSDGSDETTDDSGDSGEADAGATDAAPALLQFTAPLVGGGELDAAELSSKPTAFWFWSPT